MRISIGRADALKNNNIFLIFREWLGISLQVRALTLLVVVHGCMLLHSQMQISELITISLLSIKEFPMMHIWNLLKTMMALGTMKMLFWNSNLGHVLSMTNSQAGISVLWLLTTPHFSIKLVKSLSTFAITLISVPLVSNLTTVKQKNYIMTLLRTALNQNTPALMKSPMKMEL